MVPIKLKCLCFLKKVSWYSSISLMVSGTIIRCSLGIEIGVFTRSFMVTKNVSILLFLINWFDFIALSAR